MLAAAGRLQLQEYARFYAEDATLVRTLLRHVVRPYILPCKEFGSKKSNAVFWSIFFSSRGLELARCKRRNLTETAKDAVSPIDHDYFILASGPTPRSIVTFSARLRVLVRRPAAAPTAVATPLISSRTSCAAVLAVFRWSVTIILASALVTSRSMPSVLS